MVGLRKGCCYRKLDKPYTRKSKFKIKGYIKAIPNHKITRFEMGEKRPDYQYAVKLIAKNTLQLRHNSIESARMVVNRLMQRDLGTNYLLRVAVYPHQAIRENKMLGGAHADRIQSGMAHPFGKVAGVAAQVKAGKEVFVAFVYKGGLDLAKNALKTANPRMPGTYRIIVEPLAK